MANISRLASGIESVSSNWKEIQTPCGKRFIRSYFACNKNTVLFICKTYLLLASFERCAGTICRRKIPPSDIPKRSVPLSCKCGREEYVPARQSHLFRWVSLINKFSKALRIRLFSIVHGGTCVRICFTEMYPLEAGMINQIELWLIETRQWLDCCAGKWNASI